MMDKIFLDTNVLLDLLLNRAPFAEDITQLIESSISSGTRLCVSPISITNMNYIIGKLENQRKADVQTKKVLELVEIEQVGQTTIHKAAESDFKDFEKAVQNYCAEESGHEIIITRNTKDYKASELSILTPKEYMARLYNE
jgi:predicted nucleic acid-binding protein